MNDSDKAYQKVLMEEEALLKDRYGQKSLPYLADVKPDGTVGIDWWNPEEVEEDLRKMEEESAAMSDFERMAAVRKAMAQEQEESQKK